MTEASLGELKIGSPVRLLHCHHESSRSTVGPIVRIKESGEICFLTAWHKFQSEIQPTSSYIGWDFVKIPRFGDSTCGKVVAVQLDETIDAALISISNNYAPKRCRFDSIQEGQMESIGLNEHTLEYQPTYDIDAVDLSKITFPEDKHQLKVVKFGCTSGVTEGELHVENGKAQRKDVSYRDKRDRLVRYDKHYKIYSKESQVFCNDGDTGAAVYLIDTTKIHLHCIGMVVRVMDDGSALVTPINTILKNLGRQMGRTLELATFLDINHDLFVNSGFDYKDKLQFDSALQNGKETDNFVRLMIVGQYNHGKTSLTNNLLEMPTEKTESTKGVDIHINKGKIVGDHWIKITDPVNEAGSRLSAVNIDIPDDTGAINIDAPDEILYERTASTGEEKRTDCSNVKDDPHTHTESAMTERLSSPNAARLRTSFFKHINKGPSQKKLYVNIWDFGGQALYYATHQIFHSIDSIYILVFDLTQDLEQVVVNEEFQDMRYKMTMKDHIKFWVYSIHFFVGSIDTREPTIILVGTHKNNMNEDDIKSKFHKILNLFSGKPARDHIHEQTFAVENTNPDDQGIKDLKKAIRDIGLKKANKRQLPSKWIQFELGGIQTALEKKYNMLTFDQLLEILKETYRDLNVEPDEFRAFLKYQNSKGNVVYVNENDSQEYIAIDPQFLVEAFKCIMTRKDYCMSNPELQPLYNNLMETAILEKKLIEGIWNEYKFSKCQPMLLNLLKRYKVLAETLDFDDSMKTYIPTGKYMVPSLLKNECETGLLKSFLENRKTTECTLRFEFDDVAVLRTLYERVSAVLLARWAPLEYKDTKLVFRDLGIYLLENHYEGMLMLKEDEGLEITVSVIPQCMNDKFADICGKFRKCIEDAIEYEFRRYRHSRQEKPYQYRLVCNNGAHDGKGSKKAHDYERVKVRGETQVPCPDNHAHVIKVPIATHQWFYDVPRDKPNNAGFERLPSEKDLCIIAQSIGEGWIFLGIEQLDLTHDTIERIKMDYTTYGVKTVILNMLFEWKKSNPTTMLYELIEKLENCKALTVNWEKVNSLCDSTADVKTNV